MVEIFDFAVHYYIIRDYVYITFIKPDIVEWSRTGNIISIRIKDNSIFRQYCCELQEFLLNSSHDWNGVIKLDEMWSMLKGRDRSGNSDPVLEKAMDSVANEADYKIQHLFSGVPNDYAAPLRASSYKEFIKIYREILQIALFERHWSEANNAAGHLTYHIDDLSNALSSATSIPVATCRAVVIDIAAASHGTFNFIKGENTLLLFPFCFSLTDGVNAALKQLAQKSPKAFSDNYANVIGDTLVTEVASYFSSYKNFRVVKEIDLAKYNPLLPDIDLLAISYEPSLGFHFFACEMKNNLPASSAKEYLKSIEGSKYILKALSQISLIQTFLNTEPGQRLLWEKASAEFKHLDWKKLFPQGMLLKVDHLVVTSQSFGMFLPGEKVSIIAKNMFRHIIANSDGDVNYIQYALRELNSSIDACYRIGKNHVSLPDLSVKYDVCNLTSVIRMPKNEFLSIGRLEALEQESLDSGYTFVGHLLSQETYADAPDPPPSA